MAIVNSRAAIEPKTGKAAIFVNETIPSLMRKLFSNGEQGFFYDTNDLSTMYQDAAGTVPVTGEGQTVGLMLDKSKGLVLGKELASVTEVVSLPIDGVAGVKTYSIGSVDVGKTYQISFTVSNFTGSGDVGIAGPTTQWLDGTSVSISSNGTKRCIRTKLATSEVFLYTRSTAACVFSNISIKEIKGNHAYQTTSASRPILRKNDVTGANYLEFDGSDDFLVTNSIDFTSTDKMSLFAGVRKLSDATRGVLVHTGSFTPSPGALGNFSLEAPSFEFKGYSASLPGASGNFDAKNSTASAPHSAVLSTKLWQSAPNKGAAIQFKVNNILAPIFGAEAMFPGNFGNLPMYIGRRGGTSLPFKGHLYSLIGIGRLTTDSETATLERLIAKNTGATLNV